MDELLVSETTPTWERSMSVHWNTKEHEDETQNPRSISTSELMSVPMAELTSKFFLHQLQDIDRMMCDFMNRRDGAPLSGELESPQQ